MRILNPSVYLVLINTDICLSPYSVVEFETKVRRSFAKISQLQRRPTTTSVLNVKAIVGAFNQERALAGASSMILKSSQTFA